MAVVVSDTSPIRALAHLKLVHALQALFDEVYLPPAVLTELENPPPSLSRVDLANYPFLKVQAPSRADRVEFYLQRLDPGEAEALALAEEIHAAAVLIDEAAGRAAATENRIPVVGTLGILLRAKTEGVIEGVEPLIESLRHELGFFISERLRTEILERAGELAS